jgi:hypothetical protein
MKDMRSEEVEMKGRLVALVGVFCIASLIVFGADAKGKPDKPPKPNGPETELIVFTGDLEGGQEVEGCCPNAGPFPPYTMDLDFPVGDLQPGTYDGQLFINFYGAGRDQKYKVQFWNDDIGLAIEIIGGVIFNDKKNKVLRVEFSADYDECVDLYTKEHIAWVTFTLERSRL